MPSVFSRYSKLKSPIGMIWSEPQSISTRLYADGKASALPGINAKERQIKYTEHIHIPLMLLARIVITPPSAQ